jgi:hypothetical protein
MRMAFCPPSTPGALRVRVRKRRAEGKSDREIRRCLKRHLMRRLFKLLQRVDSL